MLVMKGYFPSVQLQNLQTLPGNTFAKTLSKLGLFAGHSDTHLQQFEASLVYKVSSRTARLLHIETLYQKNKTKKLGLFKNLTFN